MKIHFEIKIVNTLNQGCGAGWVLPRDENPDPLPYSLDPDPTCNNGFIKLFSFGTKYNQESTNLKNMDMEIKLNTIKYYPLLNP